MENLTPFYDSTTGTGFFNLKQQENAFSDRESRHLLESFSSCLDLQQLLQKYYAELKARVSVNHLAIDTPVGHYRAGQANANQSEKSMIAEYDDEPAIQIRHFYNNTLSIRAQQIIRELHRILRIPLRNAIAFTQLQQVAMKDPLTSLGNRTMYNDTLGKLCRQAQRSGEDLTLLVLDLDKFKPVNDFYGHNEGDKVLVAFSEELSRSLRASDYAFRFGGDEFCCIIQGDKSVANNKIVPRLLHAIRNNMILKKHDITCSVGLAGLKANDTPESLFLKADEALYSAKRQGRDCIVHA